MKKIRKISCMCIVLMGIIVMGHLNTNAKGMIGTSQTSEENSDTSEMTSEQVTTESITEEASSEEGNTQDDSSEDGSEESSNDTSEETNQEVTTEISTEATTEVSTETTTEEEIVYDSEYYEGLYYYLNKYRYDCEVTYLQKYSDYLQNQIVAYERMYELGEVTELTVESYKAQQNSISASMQVARNESEYYNFYLTKNELDYSTYQIKEMKTIYDMTYYKENYPERNHMSFARYVTNYNNALVQMEAKKTEIEVLQKNVEMSNALYEKGEISKLQYLEQEVSLAKAQYELECYYVEMNLAYVNLLNLQQ